MIPMQVLKKMSRQSLPGKAGSKIRAKLTTDAEFIPIPAWYEQAGLAPVTSSG
jgi:hypothetical protein